jgi:hypothetical protein
MTYEIQTQNRESKQWESLQSGKATSRRKFLSQFDRKVVAKTQWRCIATDSE